MYLDEIGEIIASRQLCYIDESNKRSNVFVLIGKPQKGSDGLAFFCPFQIKGIASESIKYAKGLDAVQALQAVMLLIGANLQYITDHSGCSLNWEGDDAGGVGFPLK